MIFSEMHPILGAIVTGAFVYFIGILIALYRYLLGGKGLKYEGKHAFITGGSTGLGLSLATMLYAKGAKVTIVARTEAKLKKAAETISKEGKDQVQYFCFDLSNPDVNKVEELFTQAEDKFGDVEYLFCNAGSSLPTMFLEADLDYYESQMKTNYLNYVKTSQTMAKRMAQRRSGTIVYVSSILGALTCVGYSAYSPSKHAIKALADVVRIELAPYNVNVHLFLPGSILTPGYYEENKMKPEVSKRVEGTADFLEPDKCAHILLNGMERGNYLITTEMLFELTNPASIGSCDRSNVLLNLALAPLSVLANYFINYVNHSEMAKEKLKKE